MYDDKAVLSVTLSETGRLDLFYGWLSGVRKGDKSGDEGLWRGKNGSR
jgi:hypothetical protein